jgi:hypothetical protein
MQKLDHWEIVKKFRVFREGKEKWRGNLFPGQVQAIGLYYR